MESNYSIVAILALLAWPFATLMIMARTKTFAQGLVWNIVLAQLLLPVGAAIKFDMIPAIDKMSVSNFSALAAYFLFKTLAPKPRTQRPGVTELLLVMYVIGPVLTSQLNGDHLIIGQRFLPGVGLYDAVSAVEAALISLIPFFLGRRCLTTDADLQSILSALALSGACYSILLLFEVRFSPQLHYWVYGYYPSEFVQTLRDGGFRPMAFMGHGLLAAFFIMASFLSATALWLTRVPTAVPWSGLAGYLGVVLIICKSLGALIYAGFAATLILFNRPRLTLAAASVLITISLGYPIFRFAGLFPTDVILELATSINPDRAGSLKFRLDNEDRLLDRALERPVFGWGRYGRSRVYDGETGEDRSITDGRWIIDLGQFGFVGFLAEFGLLSWCVLRSVKACKIARSTRVQIHVSALTLLLSINVVDLLPNASLIPLTWLLAGALLGSAERALDLGLVESRRKRHANEINDRAGSVVK